MKATSFLLPLICRLYCWRSPAQHRRMHQSGSCSDGNITENPTPCTTSALPDEVLPEDLRYHATSTVPLQFKLRVNFRNGLASAIHPMDCTSHETEWLVSDYSFDGGIA